MPHILRRSFHRLIEKIARRKIWLEKTGIVVLPFSLLERIGSDYGGWIVPVKGFSERSICYCGGAGEDISFDLELIERFRCQIFSYDPTPRAIVHVQELTTGNSNYHFFPVGLWDGDCVQKFYAPANESHVSHSILNLQQTNTYFEAKCQRIKKLMEENRHEHIDLLKIDIEGAEYKVLNSIIEDRLKIDVICVEFDEIHHPLDGNSDRRIAEICRDLLRVGWIPVAVDRGSNFTFIDKRRVPLFRRFLFQFLLLLN